MEYRRGDLLCQFIFWILWMIIKKLLNSHRVYGKGAAMPDKRDIAPQKQKWMMCLVLAVVTLALFWQVNQHDFINLDDPIYIHENHHIRSEISLENVYWAFSTKYAGVWYPLTWLSLMLDHQLYGLNAGGYHITNLVLHILSTLLLFWLLNRMTGSLWRSAFVAALFALHPLHVETVAWITKRKDVLSAFFWMLTLCLYVYYVEKPVVKRYLPVLFSFVLALMSKQMVVTLPLMMILLDYWPLKRFKLKGKNFFWQLKEKTPFFVLSAFFSLLVVWIGKSHFEYKPYNVFLFGFPLISRLANIPISFMTYVKKIFWPCDLAVFYPFAHHVSLWLATGCAMLILAVSVFAIMARQRFPSLFVGWLWYAITIMPVIGILQSSERIVSDNYTYLPSIGIFIMAAWGMPLFFRRESMRQKILGMSCVSMLTVMAVLTWQQCGYWENSISVWTRALQVTEDNYFTRYSLAVTLLKEDRTTEAIDHFSAALRLQPNYDDAYFNRGGAYDRLGQYQRAIEDYTQVIRLQPQKADAYSNRGASCYKLNHFMEAIQDYNEALRLQPDHFEAYLNRGLAYGKLRQYQQAIDNFNHAIRLQPSNADAYSDRGFAYLLQGDKASGCRDVQRACALGNCKLMEFAKAKRICR